MRDFNLFYRKDGKLHQVLLDEQQYSLLEYYINILTYGKVNVLDEPFAEVEDT